MSVSIRVVAYSSLTAVFVWLWAPPPPVKLELSRETTYVQGPLRDDGTVDYIAALNEVSGKGVTPQNNVLTLMIAAAGPTFAESLPQEQFYQQLGIEPPAAQGHYLIPIEDFIAAVIQPNAYDRTDVTLETIDRALPGGVLNKLRQTFKDEPDAGARLVDRFYESTDNPWAAEDAPLLHAYLLYSETPLETLDRALKRPRFYYPKLREHEDDLFIGVLLPALGAARVQARLLTSRAMLRFGAGDVDAAWNDLLSVYRYARLMSQDPILITHLVGYSIESLANFSVQAMAASGKLTAAQARRMIADIEKLPARRPVAEAINYERFTSLDVIMLIQRKGLEGLQQIQGRARQWTDAEKQIEKLALQRLFDPNLVMRRMNRWYDRFVDMAQAPTYRRQQELGSLLDQEIKEAKIDVTTRMTDPMKLVTAAVLYPPEKRREFFSVMLSDLLTGILLPALGAAVRVEVECEATTDLTRVALALAAHHGDHRRYPPDVAALSPRYLTAVPADRFTGEAVRYRPQAGGYLLYSLGKNLQDDGGRRRTEDEHNADITVHVRDGKLIED